MRFNPLPQSFHRGGALLTVCAVVLGVAGCHFPNAAEKAAAPILEKNAAARGGLEAWRGIKTMQMTGKLEAGKPRDPRKLAAAYQRPPEEVKVAARMQVAAKGELGEKPVELPFELYLARPSKKRLEIQFQGQTAVQVYDGSHGWKVRPFLGRREVEPYNEEEQRLASMETDLDGPLLDADSKGSRVELLGSEVVEGHDSYKLKVTLKNKQVRTVWVDKESLLDTKVDGSRKMDGKLKTVYTYLRDYRSVNGLMVPHQLETVVEGVVGSEKIQVERVVLNPPVDGDFFSKPKAG
jgi:hypothetical protein